MVTLLTLMQEVRGSNPGAAPPTLEPISPIPRLQVAKMCQGSRKGWCTRKLSTRDDKKNQCIIQILKQFSMFVFYFPNFLTFLKSYQKCTVHFLFNSLQVPRPLRRVRVSLRDGIRGGRRRHRPRPLRRHRPPRPLLLRPRLREGQGRGAGQDRRAGLRRERVPPRHAHGQEAVFHTGTGCFIQMICFLKFSVLKDRREFSRIFGVNKIIHTGCT